MATWGNGLVVLGVVATPWFSAPALVLWTWSAFYLTQQVTLVPTNCYAVVGRAEIIHSEVLGAGFHEIQFGDKVAVVPTNERVLDICVKNVKFQDELVLESLKIQVTVKPEPRIAGDDGVNVFARWVIEGLAVGDDNRAEHNVQHGLEGAIKAILRVLTAEVNSDVFDESPNGFKCLLEAHLTCHELPHESAECIKKVGSAPADATQDAILRWYESNHQKITHWIEKKAGEYAVKYTDRLDPHSISHTEALVGCSVDHVDVVEVTWSPATLKLRQLKETAKLVGESELEKAERDRATEVFKVETLKMVEAGKADAAATAKEKDTRVEAARRREFNLVAQENVARIAALAQGHAQTALGMGADPGEAVAVGNSLIDKGSLMGFAGGTDEMKLASVAGQSAGQVAKAASAGTTTPPAGGNGP